MIIIIIIIIGLLCTLIYPYAYTADVFFSVSLDKPQQNLCVEYNLLLMSYFM